MFWNELSETQKIDYIYKQLKSKERWWYFSLFLKFSILFWIIYIYSTVDLNELISDLSSEIAPHMSSFIAPISQDIMNNMVNDMNSNMQIDQEMLNKLRDNFSN